MASQLVELIQGFRWVGRRAAQCSGKVNGLCFAGLVRKALTSNVQIAFRLSPGVHHRVFVAKMCQRHARQHRIAERVTIKAHDLFVECPNESNQ